MDVQRTLEHDLELLCLTGVEDKLQVILCAKTVSSVVNNDILRSRSSNVKILYVLLKRFANLSQSFVI